MIEIQEKIKEYKEKRYIGQYANWLVEEFKLKSITFNWIRYSSIEMPIFIYWQSENFYVASRTLYTELFIKLETTYKQFYREEKLKRILNI